MKPETADRNRGFNPSSDAYPNFIKLVDTGAVIPVDLQMMKLDGDSGSVNLYLLDVTKHLRPKLAESFANAMLDALNGKRKVSTVFRWCNEFRLFTSTMSRNQGSPISEIGLSDFNNFTTNKGASSIKLLRSILKFWANSEENGLSDDLVRYIHSSKAPKPRSTIEIQNSERNERPLSIKEMQAIISQVQTLYINEVFNSQDFLLWTLLLSEALRPSQLRLLRIEDVTLRYDSQEVLIGASLRVPIVKQAGMAARDFLVSTTPSIYVAVALEEHIRFLESICDKEIPKATPLFCYNSRDNTIQRHGILIDHLIHRSRKHISSGLDGFSDSDLFSRRFKHTKLTHLSVRGAPLQVLAKAGYQTSTVSLKHYINLSDEAFDNFQQALSEDHSKLAEAFQGSIIDDRISTERNRRSDLLSPNFDDAVGNCPIGLCGVLVPLGCYTCPKMQAFHDGPHQSVLDFLIDNKQKRIEMGLPLESVNRDDPTIFAVKAVIKKIKDKDGS